MTKKLDELMLDRLAQYASLGPYRLFITQDVNFESVKNQRQLLNNFINSLPEDFTISEEVQIIYSEKYNYYFSKWCETKKDKPLSEIEKEIFRAVYRLGGIFDAFVFAVEVNGNKIKIQQEIDKRIELLEESIEAGVGSAQPTASPRIHRDGYIEGLKQTLTIINEESEK